MSNKMNPKTLQVLNRGRETSAVGGGFSYLIARVTHIVQGPTYVGTNVPDPYYLNPTSLGLIEFQMISDQTSTREAGGNQVAKPMFASIKQYPLEGEIVLIFPGPSPGMNEGKAVRDYYYMPAYNMWNDSHHNAFPDLGDYGNYLSRLSNTYEESLGTNQPVNTAATGSTTMPLGPNFFEKADMRNLRQFTGDLTVEGRWGNSIRLGSSNPVPADQNPWSRTYIKDNVTYPRPGNPITIIRNGQGKPADVAPWIPTVENINTDPTSVYLTQGQVIVIDDINNNFSLASLDTALTRTYTVAVPIQQQLTSTSNIAANEQDTNTLAAVGSNA